MNNMPTAIFATDISPSIGRVFGPNTLTEWLTLVSVEPEGDRFRATYRYATSEELANEFRLRSQEATGTRE